jgi:Domain of unknown function (DUF222)/HNH endonuclease
VELDAFAAALDQLVGSDPSAYADQRSIQVLQRQLAQLEAFTTQATAAFDEAGNWVADGAVNATAWLTTSCHLPRSQARRQVRRGRDLRHLPECARAWADGDITGSHVDAVASLRNEATEEALARDDAMLIDQARSLRFDGFVRAGAYWKQLADPDSADEDAEKRRSRRDVYLAKSFAGMWLGAMTLDPISGSIVSAELERLESELFEAEWAEAREAIGRDPNLLDLARTPAQRRADALVEMATRSRTCPRDGRRPAPLFTVMVGYETLHGRICQLGDGDVLAPGSLLRWLDQADLERAVFAPARRVEIGATARLFSGATRRAIEVRDRECTHPYCDVPSRSCQIDHVQPWAEGGPTTQENGRLLCGFHNRLRNERPPPAA